MRSEAETIRRAITPFLIGRPGYFARDLQVYDRAGQRGPRCTTRLRGCRKGQRSALPALPALGIADSHGRHASRGAVHTARTLPERQRNTQASQSPNRNRRR
ncbi:MAG: hypothetical protein ACREWG_05160 [Gammaproteobacteria bacterium]